MRIVAWPSRTAFTRQSTRCSPSAAIVDRLLQIRSGLRAYRLRAPAARGLAWPLQIVVHVGREHDFVVLDEEPRRLQPHDDVLARDDFGRAFADARARPMPQTLIFQAVRFSGMSSSTSATPSALVSRACRPRGPCRQSSGGSSARRAPAGLHPAPRLRARCRCATSASRAISHGCSHRRRRKRASPASCSVPLPRCGLKPVLAMTSVSISSTTVSRRTRRGSASPSRSAWPPVAHRCEVRLALRLVAAPPLPEELANVAARSPPAM